MNHIAINVRAEKFDEYYQRLVDKGVEVTPILNHDNSPTQSSAEMRSEEHTSELQSLMRISYAVFCLKKKKHKHNTNKSTNKQSEKPRAKSRRADNNTETNRHIHK